MDRTGYKEETLRTLPLMEGRTVGSTFAAFDIESGEVSGLTIRFTDNTEVTLRAEVVSNGATGRFEGPSPALDVARSTGLYRRQESERGIA